MKLRIEIDCDDAIFGDDPDDPIFTVEVAHLLHRVVKRMEMGWRAGKLLTTHGNTVGTWVLEEAGDAPDES